MNESTPYQPYVPVSPIAPKPIPPPAPVTPRGPLVLSLRILAAIIPLFLILYVLYWNILPLGYSRTVTIQAGALSDTVGDFHLEESKGLSARKSGVDTDGNPYTFREVTDTASAVFKTKAVLTKADMVAVAKGENIEIIPSAIDPLPKEAVWDNSWDFNKGVPSSDFFGEATYADGCTQFDGTNRLELKDSFDKFERGPFSIYTEWKPTDGKNSNQQIVGHFNWELIQNKDNVTFRIGRVNDAKGEFYILRYPVTQAFFNKKHDLLAQYNPSKDSSKDGYIELFVDGNFAGRKSIGKDIIWDKYGRSPLSLGKTDHNNGSNPNFKGCVFSLKFSNELVFKTSDTAIIKGSTADTRVFIFNTTSEGILRSITLKVNE